MITLVWPIMEDIEPIDLGSRDRPREFETVTHFTFLSEQHHIRFHTLTLWTWWPTHFEHDMTPPLVVWFWFLLLTHWVSVFFSWVDTFFRFVVTSYLTFWDMLIDYADIFTFFTCHGLGTSFLGQFAYFYFQPDIFITERWNACFHIHAIF